MGLINKFFNNTRKPEGFLGKIMVNSMNSGHSALADWGLVHLITEPSSIAELGCGGGRNAVELLKKYPSAKLTALDYSEVSVEQTKKTAKIEIESGRCTVVQGDVSKLPFEDAAFDLATAFETIYFWKLRESFAEVYRILKVGGSFMIVNESNGENKTDEKWVNMIDGMKIYTSDQLADTLREVGFTDVVISKHDKKPWVCVIAGKNRKNDMVEALKEAE